VENGIIVQIENTNSLTTTMGIPFLLMDHTFSEVCVRVVSPLVKAGASECINPDQVD
jgi:hypothetical protein